MNKQCIICRTEEDERDDWAYFKEIDATGLTSNDILICPKCLQQTSMFVKYNEYSTDANMRIEAMNTELERLRKIEKVLQNLALLLEETKGK